ncbi:Transmembrane protein 14A [Tetrabaena socialis]|uniref:Transmembrane protein 14A n=1 Tax=Tetrabaena socialis TaxID=47790 RepID=A0A2J8A1M4_9CHLO|nr:Transmembrane protein 14A [Tetrabaena socialis]|eukprot:PNH06431.1 Transmembrane protein 14A [Tetrabaena socialis]
MPPSGEIHLDLALSALTSLGGIMGYVKKKSLPSLLGGLTFGVAFGASAYIIQNQDALLGHSVGCATSALMLTMMGARFVRTRKMMPAGVLAGTGLIGLAYHAQKARQWS